MSERWDASYPCPCPCSQPPWSLQLQAPSHLFPPCSLLGKEEERKTTKYRSLSRHPNRRIQRNYEIAIIPKRGEPRRPPACKNSSSGQKRKEKRSATSLEDILGRTQKAGARRTWVSKKFRILSCEHTKQLRSEKKSDRRAPEKERSGLEGSSRR